MRVKFYEDLVNAIDKVSPVTLDEKHDKTAAMSAVTQVITARGGELKWNGKKFIVIEK
jgi:hypothetical protein